MFAIPEQFSNATKANFESQFALFSSLTNKAFEGVEKFVDLNITAAKASLEESSVATKQLLAAKDPQEFFTLTAAQAQPVAEKAIAYGRTWHRSLPAPALSSAKPPSRRSPRPTAR